MSIVGDISQPHILVHRRRGVEHGQGTIGCIGWARRGRLMFYTWKARVTNRDPAREGERFTATRMITIDTSVNARVSGMGGYSPFSKLGLIVPGVWICRLR